MSAKTRGVKWLEERSATFRVVTFTHKAKGARASAEALDYPVERVVKSLVVELRPKEYVFALMPGDKELSLKKLGRATRSDPHMAKPANAEKLTGYRVGGISPFGSYAPFSVYSVQNLTPRRAHDILLNNNPVQAAHQPRESNVVGD